MSGFATKVKSMNSKKTLLQNIKYIIAIEAFYANDDKISGNMSQDNALQGKSLLKQVIEKKRQNLAEDAIIKFIKDYIIEKISVL